MPGLLLSTSQTLIHLFFTKPLWGRLYSACFYQRGNHNTGMKGCSAPWRLRRPASEIDPPTTCRVASWQRLDLSVLPGKDQGRACRDLGKLWLQSGRLPAVWGWGREQRRMQEFSQVTGTQSSTWAQGLNPRLLHWQAYSLPVSPRGRTMYKTGN